MKIKNDHWNRPPDPFSGKPLITPTKQYNGQIEIGNKRWLTIPPQTKDKLKTLKVISAQMHLNLEIIQHSNQCQKS